MSSIKIASCIPIGSLSRFGYQYLWKEIISLQSKTFDKVYIYVTTRENLGFQVEYENVEVIVDDDVLFELDDNCSEKFDIYRLYAAYNNSRKKAKEDGVDFVINMSINMYLNEENSKLLRKHCGRLKAEKIPFSYAAKAFQLGRNVCYPNTLNPMIVNIEQEHRVKLDIDVMESDGQRNGWVGGDHKSFPFFVTDVYGVETEEDLEDKYNWYVKSYMKQWKGEDVVFNYSDEVAKFKNKLGKISINSSYKDQGEVELIDSCIGKMSMVNTINVKMANKYAFFLKGKIMSVLYRVGFLKYIGNK